MTRLSGLRALVDDHVRTRLATEARLLQYRSAEAYAAHILEQHAALLPAIEPVSTRPKRTAHEQLVTLIRWHTEHGATAAEIQARYPNQPIEKIRAIQQELATAAATTRPAGGDQSLSTRA